MTDQGVTRSGSWSSETAIALAFGPDAVNIGISNISYSVTPASLSAVPVPPAAPLLLAGLGAVALLRRDRG